MLGMSYCLYTFLPEHDVLKLMALYIIKLTLITILISPSNVIEDISTQFFYPSNSHIH